MSDSRTYITAHCCIHRGEIYKDGMLLLKDETNSSTTDFLLSAYKYFNVDYPKFYKMDNLCKLGFLAVELLLKERRIAEAYSPESIGIVFSNASSSLDADLHYFESVKNIPSPAQFVYTLPNIVIGEVSIRHRCKGENAFFVNERFDAGFMQFYVQDLMARNRVKACISGWVECLGAEYKAVVYLVESHPEKGALPFDIEHIHQIYEIANGEING
ncbi:hypothetical protein [Agriterribacter sp.]|uniref:hypothetical protein n=1 Tax=Agriterribacter sp. TaxID=2821509 RepID=UPI002B885B81|nr:hypothetical protein [Agriterribacter sp.]HRO44235.1 hypothetical protein [Agriterribacter sp.]HRQ18856.1 hypothetical protein [Agriterribacter sp.]